MANDEPTELQEWLQAEQKDDNVSKELFSDKGVKVRTEVSDNEIKAIAKINFISEYLDLENFPKMITEFLELRISHKRKSRGEFIKSLTSRQQNSPFGGMFGGRGGMNGGGGFQ